MKRVIAVLLFIMISMTPAASGAWDGWSFQLLGGVPFSFTTPLKITQSGQSDIKGNARYKSKPFESPFYYAVRVGTWQGDRAWEVELVHNKLYLDNPPPEVQGFSITHGFNMLTVNRAWDRGALIYRLGAGVVVTHPENTVRGRKHPEDGGILGGGYYISGPTAQAAVEKRFAVWRELTGALEGKVTASWARVPVEGGHADVPNVAVHGLFGLGYGR
ncbi:MAG: hypothetical protein M1550_04405 [Deltaproteobacteria bacterium]|nr:hypothetical protein [Deltaproteobacteria bacterium]